MNSEILFKRLALTRVSTRKSQWGNSRSEDLMFLWVAHSPISMGLTLHS